ncbi:MAG: Tfx family DNA-binding protein [Candidatus Hadarchaeum sp.]|uniref:Tfx family DNA-binding protein n=1 Tax=Candidatus Hadarchaeum sp. TaxID=2883567 RepID=UPI0031714B51
MEDTFLTESQLRVLELRMRGLTQAEIARRLNTSRANVSILERRARENIARAERTLKLFERLKAPVTITVKPGEDILQVPKKIFDAADAAKIRVKQGTAEIIARIKEEAGDRIHGRSITKNFEIALTSNGEILIS